MTEAASWTTWRRHLAPYGQLLRVENALMAGFPDVLYCLRGRSGLLELKTDLASLTLEQVLLGEAWTAAGGAWWLGYRGQAGAHKGVWALFDARGARLAYSKMLLPVSAAARLWTTGAFPLQDVLDLLAPRVIST